MATKPTIVIGSLNDKELTESINKLVQTVGTQSLKMAQEFDAGIQLMRESIRSLGREKINLSPTNVSARSIYADEIKKEQERVESAAISYDKFAQARHRAVTGRGEYLSFTSDVDKSLTYLVYTNKDVDAQLDAILRKEQELLAQKQKEAQVTREISNEQAKLRQGVSGASLGWGTVHDMNSRHWRSGSSTAGEIDYLRQQIASLLNVKESDIKKTEIQTATYGQLNAYLRQLQQAYRALSFDNLKREGTDIAQEIQKAQRALQQMQQQMLRPVSLSAAMGHPEKTIDDIHYKIQQLQSYKRGINITDPKQASEIKTVDAAINRLQNDLNKYMGSARQASQVNNALTRSWNYMKNRLAFYFTVGASTQFVRNLIEVRSQYELNERALGILINSAERGSQIFQELSNMSLISPYTLIELSSAAKQLTAYDVAARDVVDTTRRLADMAAAVGIPMERLTYALGQIKAYGYLNSRDNRMFANAGIPLVKQLSEYYTELEGRLISTADVYDRIKKKAVGYGDVMQVIYKMTDEGGKFFDFQAKMADTLKVRLANLTLAWNNMLNDIGKETQGFLTVAIGALRQMFLHWRELDRLIKGIGLAIGFRTLFAIIRAATIGLGAFGRAMTWNAIAGKKLGGIIFSLGKSIKTLVMTPTTWWSLLALAVADAGMALYEANERVKEFNNSIREGGKENLKNIKDYLNKSESILSSLYTTNVDAQGNTTRTARRIDENTGTKAWEEMREQIELSSVAGETYVGKLLKIEDISERLRQGFALLSDLESVNSALSSIGDKAIKVPQEYSGWWNLYAASDGLVQNLKDYSDIVNDGAKETNFLEQSVRILMPAFGGLYNVLENNEDAEAALKQLREDLEVTKESIKSFIQGEGWTTDVGKINETYAQLTHKLILENNLDPQSAYILQMEMEDARSEASYEALQIRINDEKRALAAARDENAKAEIRANLASLEAQEADFEKYNGRSKFHWEQFTKFLSERHRSEVSAMFRDMDEEQIKSLVTQGGAFDKWIKDVTEEYAKTHKLSYDEAFKYLKNWVKQANQWAVFIKLHISTEDKSVLSEVEKADKDANEAVSALERLNRLKNDLEKKLTSGTANAADAKLYDSTIKAIRDQEEALTDAHERYGHETKKEKKDAAAARRAAKAREKAQKEAEQELQKTLGNSLKLIDKVRRAYKDLMKEGLDAGEAMLVATEGYEKSQAEINKVLGKWGLPALDLKKLAPAENPREVLNVLEQWLNGLISSGKVKPLAIQELETKVKDLKLDVEKFDATTLIDSLNSEFAKIKDEYELALSLDEYPELGDAFSSILGIKKEEFDKLPRNLYTLGDRLQDAITDMLSARGYKGSDIFNIFSGVRVEDWAEQIKIDKGSALYRSIDEINKFFVDTTRKTLTEVEKEYTNLVKKRGELADKIGEIEATRLRRQRELENSYANRQSEKMSVRYTSKVEAINKDAIREEANAYFEAFKNTPYYVNMFENLQYVGSRTLRTMKNDLDKLRTSLSGLSPQNVKEIVQQMEKIDEELIKKNPFRNLTSNFKSFVQARTEIRNAELNASEAHERASDEEQVLALWEKKRAQAVAKGKEDEVKVWDAKIAKQRKAVRLAKDEEEAQQGTLHTLQKQIRTFMQQINEVWKVISANIASLGGLRDYMVEMGVDVGDWLNGAIDGLMEFNDGINQIISSAQNLDVVGTLTGVIKSMHGIMDSVASIFGGGSANEYRINKELKRSEQRVKSLQYAYLDLQYAMEDAYGAAVAGAKRVAIANKQLELQEIQRQIRLEESRSKKKRDQDRILELRQQYKELSREIKTSTDEIVDDLLGSDRANFAENLVSSMIDAFKQGEDYMQTFEESFEQMVDNMIMKAIVSKVVAQYMDSLFDGLNNRIEERSADEREAFQDAQKEAAKVETLSDKDIRKRIAAQRYKEDMRMFGYDYNNALSSVTSQDIADYRKAAEDALKAAETRYAAVSAMTDSDIDWVMAEIAEKSPELGEMIKNLLGNYYKFGEANKELSQLQQGIQGITETTANALEAYMNGVSQQVYLHSDLLTQIRDAVVSFDVDVQTATMGQILLQLQASYNAQMAIQSTLEGWNAPNGMAVRVQMV